MAETNRVQTRGQITLIATPDYKVTLTPSNVMIPVADDGGSFNGQPFTQIITFKATNRLNQSLTIIGVSLLIDNNKTLKIEDKNSEGLYYYTFTKTNEELKTLPDSGQLTFYVTLENESIGAEDDFVVDVSFSYAKAKSGRDGTPAYGVNLYTENQIFIRSLDENGNYIFEPSQIDLKTELINFTEEQKKKVSYKWYLNNVEIGQGATYPITPSYNSETQTVNGTGMYEVKVYYDDIFSASDILGIASAVSGTESFTVLLTNDSEIVSVDRNDYTIDSGQVSTGILVYKGAERITNFDVILGEDSGNDADGPYKEVLNNVTFEYNKDNQTITGTYGKGVTIGEKLKITISAGDTSFIKYFYVKASLAGESAKMIKVTGPQFFQVDAQGFITPDSIQLTANPQNIKDLWGWFYYDNEWILIPQGNLSDNDYKFLTITSDDEKWKNKNILEIKAAVYEMDENGNISFNDFYQDTYPVYKNIAGKDSYSIIPSNETINIITNAFGQPVETRDYPINLKVFSGTIPVSFEISEIGIAEGYSNPFIEIEKNSNEADILIKVNKDASQNTEFYNTPINFKVKINGVTETISKTIYLQPAQQGADAKQMAVSGGQVFRYNNAMDGKITYNPSSTEIVCITNVDHYAWSYSIGTSINGISIGTRDKPLEITPDFTTSWGVEDILTIKAYECDSTGKAIEDGIFDEITLYKVRDGSDGSDSIFVYPLNPSIIFTESSETGKLIEQTITCQIASFVGIDNKLPDAFSISNSNTDYYAASYDDKKGIISVTTKTDKNVPINETERVGEIQCSATLIDTKNNSHIFNFSIKWTIIKGGVDGNGIDYINNYYYAMSTNDETSLPARGDTAWKQKVTDTTYSLIDMYLWNYEEIKFTKNDKPTTTEPFIIGVYGKEGRGIKSFTTYYKVTAAQKPQPSLPLGSPESDNWYPQNSENIEQNSDYPFLWSYELVTYDNEDTEMVGPRLVGSLGKQGLTGPKTAIVYLYSNIYSYISWNSSLIYNFGNKKIISNLPYGWYQTPPANNNGTIYITSATAYNTEDTDDILANDWSVPTIWVQSGEDVSDKIASITKYYITNNQKPELPSITDLIGENATWSSNISSIQITAEAPQVWSVDLIIYENSGDYLIQNLTREKGAEADSFAQQIYDGTKGLGFTLPESSKILKKADLNQDVGLYIENTGGYSVQIKGSTMGFYNSNGEVELGYDTAAKVMLLKGTIYADAGKIGALNDTDDENKKIGWTILGSEKDKDTGVYSPAAIYSGDRSNLGSTAKGIYIGTDGISMGIDGAEEDSTVFRLNYNEDQTSAEVKIVGDVTATNFIALNGLSVDKITGFNKSGIRKTIGFFHGQNENDKAVTDIVENGDIYVKFSSKENSTDSSTNITVTNGEEEGAFEPEWTYGYLGRDKLTYNGIEDSWNRIRETDSHPSDTYDSYAKVGFFENSKTALYRGAITPKITGAKSVSKMIITFMGTFKGLDGYDIKQNTPMPNGVLYVSLYEGNSSTIAGSGILDLSKYSDCTEAEDYTFSVEVEGNFKNNTKYYIIIKGSKGNYLYIKEKTFELSGGESTEGLIAPGIFIRSNNNWAQITGEGGAIEDKDTTYNLDGYFITNSGYRVILNNEDNASASTSVTIPIATSSDYGLLKPGNGLSITNGILTLSTNTAIFYNGITVGTKYNNTYIYKESLPSGTGYKDGDICFVY